MTIITPVAMAVFGYLVVVGAGIRASMAVFGSISLVVVGAGVGVEVDTGVATGAVESQIAGVVAVTGWTLDWVRTGVHKIVP